MPTADVLSEDVILNWFKKDHSSRGKGHFLEQMKKFVEWLQNAEEGMHSIDSSVDPFPITNGG